ncbi:MAG: ATP-binding cassette domain-containing protein [Desulfobulbaceae bacterium]|nr:MAG: ATP-binding cassette domain-containing protein [Desulfobulbaceae bacterium]
MLYELTGVEKVLGGRKIFEIPAFSIRSERIYSLTGPNGAGKTTLLKILAFLDRPSTGQIRFCDRMVPQVESELLELRRQVVMVDQSPLLFTRTVAANVGYGLKLRKVPSAERRKRVIEALELVGMEKFLRTEAHRLSGGETKRVALARALAIRPKVLLCDEPTANVDSENQRIILDILAGINRREKTSILFSTHYQSLEQQLAHSSLHLQHGRLSESQINDVFDAELIEHDNEQAFCRLAGKAILRLPRRLVPEEPFFTVRIEQEKIRLATEEEPARTAGTPVTGRVVRVEESSGAIRVGVDCGIVLHLTLSGRLYAEQPIPVGASAVIIIPDDAVRCLANNGSRDRG